MTKPIDDTMSAYARAGEYIEHAVETMTNLRAQLHAAEKNLQAALTRQLALVIERDAARAAGFAEGIEAAATMCARDSFLDNGAIVRLPPSVAAAIRRELAPGDVVGVPR